MKNIIFFATILLFSLSACEKDGDLIIEDAALEQTKLYTNSDAKARGNNPKERPFKGTLFFDHLGDYEDCLTCPYTPTSYPFGDFRKFEGEGHLTHLGNTIAESMSCFTLIFDEGFNVLGFTIKEQCNTFIAANGDELYSYQDEYDALWNPECGCFYGETIGHFDGGTGRFDGAGGEFFGQVSQIPAYGTTGVFSGVIIY